MPRRRTRSTITDRLTARRQFASYVHTGGRQPTGHDRNFQGNRRFLTDAKGQYYFRTIKPISYTLIGIFRTAHIHLAISRNGKRVFTTQLLVTGHPDNARDSIVRRAAPQRITGEPVN